MVKITTHANGRSLALAVSSSCLSGLPIYQSLYNDPLDAVSRIDKDQRSKAKSDRASVHQGTPLATVVLDDHRARTTPKGNAC
jgi:hypothetical protein